MEKHIKYCPICDKYHPGRNINCAFCNRKLKLAEEWECADQNEKNYWMWYSEPTIDISKLNPDSVKQWQDEATAFDVQYRKELAEEESHRQYIPKCPTCGCPDIEQIGAGEKVASAAMWGLFSRKIHKQFRCKNCGYEW